MKKIILILMVLFSCSQLWGQIYYSPNIKYGATEHEITVSSVEQAIIETKRVLLAGGGANLLGVRTQYNSVTTDNIERPMGRIGFQWEVATEGIHKGNFVVQTANVNSVSDKLLINGVGNIRLHTYGQGFFTDDLLSETESSYVLVPSTNGVILEKPISELTQSNEFNYVNIESGDPTTFTIQIGKINLVFNDSAQDITAVIPSGASIGDEFTIVDYGGQSVLNDVTIDYSTNGYVNYSGATGETSKLDQAYESITMTLYDGTNWVKK